MGIPGLAWFMKEHFKKWQPACLSDWENIVVDGNCICFALYKSLEKTQRRPGLGGEYKRFKNKVESFFANFKNPIVMFDGSKAKDRQGLIEKREDTMRKMQESQRPDTYNPTAQLPFPVLLSAVFKMVLFDMGIEIRHTSNTSETGKDEADKQMAILANELKCPVLSQDSDFFIFDLHHGFLLFDFISQKKLYCITDFLEQFHLRSKELRLILPLEFGKDVRYDTKNPPSHREFSRLLNKLGTMESPSDYLTDANQSEFERLKEIYDVDPTSEALIGVKEPQSEVACITSWARCKVTCSDYSKSSALAEAARSKKTIFASLTRMQQGIANVLPAVFEIVEEKSAWRIGRKIRQYLVGFMGLSVEDKVAEIIREDGKTSFRREEMCPRHLKPPVHIRQIKSMWKVERCDLVLTVLGCHSIRRCDIKQRFNCLEDQWKLPVAATFYWYKNLEHTYASLDIVKALLLSFLTCSEQIEDNTKLPEPTSRSNHNQALHAFAQWQCVYYNATILNLLAGEPFLTTSPALLYSGEAAMYYASVSHQQSFQRRNWIDNFLTTDSCQRELFKEFLYLTTGCDEDGWPIGKHAWSVTKSPH